MPLFLGKRLEEIVVAEDRVERSAGGGRFGQANGYTRLKAESVEQSCDVFAQESMPSNAQDAWSHKRQFIAQSASQGQTP